MKEIRDSGKIVGLDRIAVMAALNLAHEVLKLRARGNGSEQEMGQRLETLRERVESALREGAAARTAKHAARIVRLRPLQHPRALV